MARLYLIVERLLARGLLAPSVVVGERAALTAVPIAPEFAWRPNPVGIDVPHRLSRFAFWRRRDEALVSESPLSLASTVVRDGPAAGIVGELARASTPRDLAERTGVDEASCAACIGLLVAVGLAGAVDRDGRLPEDDDDRLAQYDFHDLLFHTRSRRGRSDEPTGATFRFVDRIAPEPATKAPMSERATDLYAPDLECVAADDPPFTTVLERRRSVRAHGGRPIGASELGEFLYRAARVRTVEPIDVERGLLYETTSRPYPSGGATYDLELYVTVRECDGIHPGLYHYDPLGHRLFLVSDDPRVVDGFVHDAWLACAQAVLPQVVITLASRFPRLAWKYSGMAYAATLKNVGVLFQTIPGRDRNGPGPLRARQRRREPALSRRGHRPVYRALGRRVHAGECAGVVVARQPPLIPP